MKYVKLKLSFGDKLKLLFFGIISEDKLPVQEVIKEVEKVQVITEKPTPPPLIKVTDEINKKEDEEFHVPFFELNDDDVKSNF